MAKLPVLSGKKLLQILKKHGFVVIRQKGSHVFVQNLERNLSTIIPLHSNEDLGKGLLRAILNDLDLGVEDLVKML